MLKIIESLMFLAAQGIAVRGHDDENSNFKQLLKLRNGDYANLHDWMQQSRSRITYASQDVQNELLEIVAHTINPFSGM